MMRIQFSKLLTLASMLALAAPLVAQEPAASKPKPEDTEVWTPVPKIVTPGATDATPPSDAIVLFDGKNLDEWVSAQDHTPAQWTVVDGTMLVKKASGVGNVETKRRFKNYQIHLEYKIPTNITGSGQARGNSGVFLASTGGGDSGYAGTHHYADFVSAHALRYFRPQLVALQIRHENRAAVRVGNVAHLLGDDFQQRVHTHLAGYQSAEFN